MKKIFPFLFLFFILCSFFSKDNNCGGLIFDGIYVYPIDKETSGIIRFYEDKVVLVSTSVNDYSKVMTWFNRDPENFSRVLTGKYKITKSDCSIRFKVKGETGQQNFSGTIVDANTLQLHIVNPADGSATDRKYTFVKP
jgi:hypothetical protein